MKFNVEKQLQCIHKEGFLSKQSRFLKTWRERWFVLTNSCIMTFKERKVYSQPTEIIPLSTVTSIRSYEQQSRPFSYVIETAQSIFLVSASSNSEKQLWIGQIGKAIVKSHQQNE